MKIDNWRRVNGTDIVGPLVDYIEGLFEDEIKKGYDLKVCIGTDSQKHGKGYKFATAIVIETSENLGGIVVGRGAMVIGGTYWNAFKTSTNKKKHREIEVLHQRMVMEVSSSIEVAYEIAPLLELYDIKLEVHADINNDPEHASHVAMSEAIGYINAMGWESRIKPAAYAASTAADKLC